jgi:hypothetical protein
MNNPARNELISTMAVCPLSKGFTNWTETNLLFAPLHRADRGLQLLLLRSGVDPSSRFLFDSARASERIV